MGPALEFPAPEDEFPAVDLQFHGGAVPQQWHSRRRIADVRGVHRRPLAGSFGSAAKFEEGEAPFGVVAFLPPPALGVGAEGDVADPVGDFDGGEVQLFLRPPDDDVPTVGQEPVVHAKPAFRSGGDEDEPDGEAARDPVGKGFEAARRSVEVAGRVASDFFGDDHHDDQRDDQNRPARAVVPGFKVGGAVGEADHGEDQDAQDVEGEGEEDAQADHEEPPCDEHAPFFAKEEGDHEERLEGVDPAARFVDADDAGVEDDEVAAADGGDAQ